MEGQVHKDRALLDQSEVDIDLFELPLDFLHEVITPNMVVFQVNISDHGFIQINL